MFSFPDSSQLWTLDGHTLKSKENIWISNDKWNFKTKDEFILIRNFSKKKVLESTNDGKVSQETFDEHGELVKNNVNSEQYSNIFFRFTTMETNIWKVYAKK